MSGVRLSHPQLVKEIYMAKFKPIGKYIWVKTTFGGEKTNEFGIIYQERSKSKFIWSTVLAIGDKLTEDIKVGDEILWDVTQLKDGYGGNHLVHQDWVQATN